MTPAAERLRAADRHCMSLLRHYENFTVASRLTPRPLRRDLARVYAFCRTTDDLGDEIADAATATAQLRRWKSAVQAMFAGETVDDPVLIALSVTVRKHSLPAEPFLGLIDANLQDQRTHSYEDWPALLGYCTLSAAPVGRMVLGLFDVRDARAAALSDDVCIGLQLANFAQDVSVDAARGRTYLLQEDIRALGEVGAVRAMCDRGRDLLASGRQLETMVRGRLRVQLALYRLGGEAILDAVSAQGYDTRQRRPTVSRRARIRIMAMAGVALSKRRVHTSSSRPRATTSVHG
ncbi:MAG TPA: squalene/phytoene synthase family protein [Candidatus Dormibacteraeota bacterium]|nr:squalene/phytoene synthase family protein [Candidatus Dormibacteraeota bacterium]